MSADTPVLDVTCGTRAMWFDKLDPRAIMCDQRAEAITVTDRSHGRQDGTRTLTINPDVQCDFRKLPFPDATSRLDDFDRRMARLEEAKGRADEKVVDQLQTLLMAVLGRLDLPPDAQYLAPQIMAEELDRLGYAQHEEDD